MARGRRFALILASGVSPSGSLAAAGCGDDDSSSDTSGGSGGSSDLSGNILIDGSSTVAPLSSAAAEAFTAENSGVNITVGTSGTGGGFELFCKGETDISDASRAIDDDEIAACESGGVTYQELRVASDGITIVTGTDADVGATAITLAAAQGGLGAEVDDRQLGPDSRRRLQRPSADPRRPGLAVGHVRLLQRGGPR